MNHITVVDYKVANIYNIVKALEYVGAQVLVTDSARQVENARKLILPGVGAYEAGVQGLIQHGLVEPIRTLASNEVPILGICLGSQLLMSEGHEFGVFKGLNIIPGAVESFPPSLKNVKVPHIGWNALEETASWKGTVLESIPNNTMMYFNHSYYLNASAKNNVLATTTYGGFTYPVVIKKGNIYGTQFHPEKSSELGLSILKNFIQL